MYATTSSASYYSVQTDTSSKAYPLNARNTLNSSTSGDSCKFYVNFAYQGLGKVTAEYWCQPNGTQYNMAYLSDEVSMLNKTGTLMGRANTNNGTTYVSGSFGAG